MLKTKILRAIGRSRKEPSLLSSAGARLIVSLRSGKENPEDLRAARMRSLLSSMVLLPIPIILKCGSPLFVTPSTSIR